MALLWAHLQPMCTTLQMIWVGGTTEAVWGAEVVAAVAGQARNHACPVQALPCSDRPLLQARGLRMMHPTCGGLPGAMMCGWWL